MYARRRRLTSAEKAENARLRAEREAEAMTCQICGRKILANTGVIAHHGYARPGDGSQSASCSGALQSPYEVSRYELGFEIVLIKQNLEGVTGYREKVQAESIDVVFSVDVYVGISQRERKSFNLNRDNFEKLKEENLQLFHQHSIFYYEDAKFRELRKVDSNIVLIERDLARQERRFASWVHTHSWNAERQVWIHRP